MFLEFKFIKFLAYAITQCSRLRFIFLPPSTHLSIQLVACVFFYLTPTPWQFDFVVLFLLRPSFLKCILQMFKLPKHFEGLKSVLDYLTVYNGWTTSLFFHQQLVLVCACLNVKLYIFLELKLDFRTTLFYLRANQMCVCDTHTGIELATLDVWKN